VKFKAITEGNLLKSAGAAALAVLCGLLLWATPLGEAWVNASYDYLFRFGAPAVTNKVVLILMDNKAYDQFAQERNRIWDRALHTQLLNKLADDQAALVVFDSFFKVRRDPASTDEALAAAMRRQRGIVLMAEQAQVRLDPRLAGAEPTFPAEMFLSAAGTNWGVAWLDPDIDLIVRRHWPFPAPGPYPSLPGTAARLAGARLDEEPREQWLRYYGRDGPWPHLSYGFALAQPPDFFRDKIVFIGTQPHTSMPGDNEGDEFLTPYTRWTKISAGGVEIMVTAFLNLMNGDWLRRSSGWVEAIILTVSGILASFGLSRLRPLTACLAAAVGALSVALIAVSWSYVTNYWFPWLIIAGAQVPCALICAIMMPTIRHVQGTVTGAGRGEPVYEVPETPDYELFPPPFGEGAYGRVWVVRNAVGQWQALKVVYLANFDNNPDPYEREFNGIRRYKPISDKHPGLLRVDFVSKKRPGYFYYVMELGDPLDPGWEREPSTYRPRDLMSERARSRGRRLTVKECVEIGIALTDALDFLHRQGLTHRDIKPQNIIFVNGHPKLADVGLTAEIRPPDQERTFVGTPGYMPPPPEPPGTVQADIYALGMVLYVLSTGRNAAYFPEISTTLVSPTAPDFLPLNKVILKACEPDSKQRFATAAEMHQALLEVQKVLVGETPQTLPDPAH